MNEAEWIEAWRTDTYEPEHPEALAAEDWLRTLPARIHTIVQLFPPACIVRTKPSVRLLIPRPGTCGMVAVYGGPTEQCPDGEVGVVQGPIGSLFGQFDDVSESELPAVVGYCSPESLDVVMFHGPVNPSWVRRVLGIVTQ